MMTVKNMKTIGSKLQVFRGNALKTIGGLTKKHLKKNPKSGKVVSIKKFVSGKTNGWIKAVSEARQKLKIKGFVILNKGVEGTRLYKKAKEIYTK
jgi:hypothetical protein